MKTDIVVTVVAPDTGSLAEKIDAIEKVAAAAARPSDPPDKEDPVEPPALRKPYFDIGDATGKAGDVVEIVVEAGCRHHTNGFHIGGGVGKTDEERSGYGKFEAVGVKLGKYLHDYFKSQGLIVTTNNQEVDEYWSIFQFLKYAPHADHKGNPLPEEWWEYAVGFFSMQQERTVEPIQIPSGTELFTLSIRILPSTAPGEYELTCLDEHYYTTSRHRRRDFMFTAGRESEFSRGGITHVDLFGGKITVTA